MIKVFRGPLTNAGQVTIRLGTNNGLIGYKINKFEIFPNEPGAVNTEGIVKVFKTKQTSVDALVDFGNGHLIAAAYYTQYAQPNTTANSVISIFDAEIFNQDIFATYSEISGTTQLMNYYIELEQVKLDLSEATVATLKDMRGTE